MNSCFAGNLNSCKIAFNAPVKQGAYRLLVYINDGKNKVVTANFLFYVNN